MKKHLLFKPLLTLALVMMCGSVCVATTIDLTFDLKSNPGGWPTVNSTTLTNYTYKLNDVDYSFGLKNVKCNSGYLMLTQVAVLGLPAIEGYKLTKVVAKNSNGCSTAVKVGVSSTSGSEASYLKGGEIQTWATTSSTYTYNLSDTEENTVYYLYVTNKNAQIVSLDLTYDDGKTPTKELVSIVISNEPSKTDYYEGESFNPLGLVVTGTYDDDSRAEITTGITWTFDPEMLSIGTTSVDVVATVNSVNSDPFTVNGIEVRERPIVSAFYESFDTNTGKGGNDDEGWSGDIANNTIKFENEGWTYSGANGANSSVKIGSSSKAGSVTTPAVYFTIGGTVSLTFKAGSWTGDKKEISVTAINGVINQSTVTLEDSKWTEYKLTISDISGPLQVKFEGTASKNRFFLDEVKIAQVYDATIKPAKYATLCLPFNFTVPEGVTAYTGAATDDGVTLTAIEGVVPANTGVILYSETAGTYTFTGSAETPATLGTNDLVGVTEATAIPAGSYILALDTDNTAKFFEIDPSSNTLAANKAYLAIPSGVTPSKALAIRRGDATGIETIMEAEEAVYIDLMGRKVANPTPGIYILGGKKVMVK